MMKIIGVILLCIVTALTFAGCDLPGDPIPSALDDISDNLTFIQTQLEVLNDYFLNVHYIFPAATDNVILMEAGVVENTWGAWAEITANGTSFSDLFAASDGYIAGLIAEGFSVAGVNYYVEISYGTSKTLLTSIRIKPEAADSCYFIELNTGYITAGDIVYYRMMSGVGGAILECSLRYCYK